MTTDKKEPGPEPVAFDRAEIERAFTEANSSDEGIGRTIAQLIQAVMRASLTQGRATERMGEASQTFSHLISLVAKRLEQARQKGEGFHPHNALAIAANGLAIESEDGEHRERAIMQEMAIQGAWLFLEMSQGDGRAMSRADKRISELMRCCDEMREEWKR